METGTRQHWRASTAQLHTLPAEETRQVILYMRSGVVVVLILFHDKCSKNIWALSDFIGKILLSCMTFIGKMLHFCVSFISKKIFCVPFIGKILFSLCHLQKYTKRSLLHRSGSIICTSARVPFEPGTTVLIHWDFQMIPI